MAKKVFDANDQGKKLSNVEKSVGQINAYMIGIVAVTAFGFITLLFTVIGLVLTYERDNTNAYNDYRAELRSYNDKIDTLTSELKVERALKETNPVSP